ncbi:MAG: pyruvate kinase, partial [Candidatus Omnitrophica bacterium]|nr:pyruvate kinase [Candidatus Omnitrophota bacterium]MBD3269426.1 pyruvate kinase [Candidatus Omnitrophota bacterium]
MVKTKIIATLGPASSKRIVLRKMFIKGMDIARLNFSHGGHASHIKNINLIRQLNKNLRRHIRVMQDLEGYRIRVGRLKSSLELKKNSYVYLIQENTEGRGRNVPFDYYGSLRPVKKGSLI